VGTWEEVAERRPTDPSSALVLKRGGMFPAISYFRIYVARKADLEPLHSASPPYPRMILNILEFVRAG